MKRQLQAAVMLLAMAAPAHAQSLDIDGAWGNEAGCKYAKDGNYGDDDMLLLKPEGVESYVIGCDWLQVLPARDGAQVATGLCGHEGEAYRTVETYIIDKNTSEPGKMRISFATGDVWGEVSKCP